MKIVLGALVALVLAGAGAWFGGFLSPDDVEQPTAPAAVSEAAPAPEPETATAPDPEPEATPQPEPAAETADAEEDLKPATEEELAAVAAASEPPGGATRTLGWMHGDCLAIAADDLSEGDPLTVVALDDPQTVTAGQIVGVAEGQEACNLLDEQRRTNNAEAFRFYQVKTPQVIEFAVAVAHSEDAGAPPDPQMMDVDANGILDAFSHCITKDGVRFGVWAGEPYFSKELWRGVYLLERDTMPTCPE